MTPTPLFPLPSPLAKCLFFLLSSFFFLLASCFLLLASFFFFLSPFSLFPCASQPCVVFLFPTTCPARPAHAPLLLFCFAALTAVLLPHSAPGLTLCSLPRAPLLMRLSLFVFVVSLLSLWRLFSCMSCCLRLSFAHCPLL